MGMINATVIAADVPPAITPEKVRENYKTFARITKEPKSIGAEFADFCDVPRMEEMMKETGPHVMHYLHYYLNEVAQRHRADRISGAYPPGSVIVKEKLFGTGRRGVELARTAVAGMIKREPGSSPKTGDWEFFYFGQGFGPVDGKAIVWEKAKDLKSCVSCHSNAADMVFGRFNEPYVMPEMGENRKAIRLEVAPTEKLQLGPPKEARGLPRRSLTQSRSFSPPAVHSRTYLLPR